MGMMEGIGRLRASEVGVEGKSILKLRFGLRRLTISGGCASINSRFGLHAFT
jgi:hypothetical protein